jgi:hypothetical protein
VCAVPLCVGIEDAGQALVRDRCDGCSGADFAVLVCEAGVAALRRTTRMLCRRCGYSESSDDPGDVLSNPWQRSELIELPDEGPWSSMCREGSEISTNVDTAAAN